VTKGSETQHQQPLTIEYLILSFDRYERAYRDSMFQAMNNNLFSNNPGEIERWVDDGGRE